MRVPNRHFPLTGSLLAALPPPERAPASLFNVPIIIGDRSYILVQCT